MDNEEMMTPEQKAELIEELCRPDNRTPAVERLPYSGLVLTRSPIQPREGLHARLRTGFVYAVDAADAASQLQHIAALEFEATPSEATEGPVLGVRDVGRCEAMGVSNVLLGWTELAFRTEADARAYARGEAVSSQLLKSGDR
jgi:hypothetical protein